MSEPILSSHQAVTPEIPGMLRHLAPRVTVIGDAMLDGWFSGESNRMAREAPAPVVRLTGRHFAPGGAANTAMNLAAMGARVSFVGLAGRDESGERLRDLMRDAGIEVSRLILHPGVRTVTKDRIVVGDQVMVRIDDGVNGAYPADALAALAEAAAASYASGEATVVCDYATGTLDGPVTDALTGLGRRPPVVIVDARDPRRWAGLSPDLVTPNSEETSAILGTPLRRDSDRVSAVSERSAELLDATGAAAVVVTLDRDGTVTLGRSGLVHRTWAAPATDKQASGAGDTFVSALTIARACGLPISASADLAQAAAHVVVSRVGTSVCSTADLAAHLSGYADSALEPDEVIRHLEDARRAGKRIVFTNGCFDVLHRGHTAYLNQAKRLGDILVVAINDDASVRRLKGAGRPVNPVSDRAGVLAALNCVDFVTVFDADTPIPLIERIRPDVYAKGGRLHPRGDA